MSFRWIGPAALVLILLHGSALGGIKPPRTHTPSSAPDPSCVQGSTTLCVPLDASFETVPFADADPGDVCYRNDDGSSSEILLPFTFSLYGTSYTSCYINNNGNISFGEPQSSFSSTGFPVADIGMVAAFWGDVDTYGALSGVVHYRLEAHRLIVVWERVGYYGEHTDLRNTFEIILSDGTDAGIGVGNNVCLCYDDMQWTTGDASDGTGGFGGTPATAGVNRGDGVAFFQLGRFDHAGSDYDGPGGGVDGVDYLDGRTVCFDVSTGSGSNIAPVEAGFPEGNEAAVCTDSTLVLVTTFISPELGQTTTTTVDLNGLANANVTSTPGNPSTQTLTFTPDASQPGPYTVRYVATDDGTPPASRTVDLTIRIDCSTPAHRGTWGQLKARYR